MKVIFMGTPDFAVETLEAVIKAGHEVVLVVTQPDKPKGRGNAMQASPVKECALAHRIEVYQPRKIREQECVDYLEGFAADIFVVAAFGQILSQELLDMPKYGCINVHASLLPKYRGAAPIQWAVINGEEMTGVTIQQMDIGIDTGDIIAQEEVTLDADETGGSLFDKLAAVGASLCVKAMDEIASGSAIRIPQDESAATHTSMIHKDFGHIDWNKSAKEIERLVRGLNPWPSAYTHLDGKTVKIWKATVSENESGEKPGCIVDVTKDAILVQTGEGILQLDEIQLEGKKRMPCDAFLRGYHIEKGGYFA
ncbi:MAG: methionyl-tRNA formyltransferase [Agathobacter sp.]|nr:methionyl-tRNA formyltransferase [Agathobacter sp.]